MLAQLILLDLRRLGMILSQTKKRMILPSALIRRQVLLYEKMQIFTGRMPLNFTVENQILKGCLKYGKQMNQRVLDFANPGINSKLIFVHTSARVFLFVFVVGFFFPFFFFVH